jgi:cytochrome c5
VSKQDTHFFNMFSIVIGLLVAVAIVLFALSRIVAGRTQEQHVLVEAQYLKAVEERIQPLVRVAVAGQDNTALAIKPTQAEAAAGAGAGAAVAFETGADVVQGACAACHGAGIAGAPKVGDAAAWGPRIAQGKDTLYKHAIEGYQGETGVMPPKGGRTDISDELVRAAVDHMVEQSR